VARLLQPGRVAAGAEQDGAGLQPGGGDRAGERGDRGFGAEALAAPERGVGRGGEARGEGGRVGQGGLRAGGQCAPAGEGGPRGWGKKGPGRRGSSGRADPTGMFRGGSVGRQPGPAIWGARRRAKPRLRTHTFSHGRGRGALISIKAACAARADGMRRLHGRAID
jgi:hypothetical protein